MASESYHRYPPPSSDSSDTIEQRYRGPSHTSDTNEQRHRDSSFSTEEESQKYSPPRYNPGGNVDSFATPTASRDRHSKRQARYEESIQRAIDQILKEFCIYTTGWSTPLESSLTAISLMPALLKSAQAEDVSDLKLDDLDITSGHDQVYGKFPSRSLNTNIQYCADIGRLAFLNAHAGMDLINTVAQNMVGKNGKVACLIDLLEAPEVPLNVLVQKVNSIKASAAIFPKTVENISKRFEHWYDATSHLRRAMFQKYDDLLNQKHEIECDIGRNDTTQAHWQEKQLALKSNILDLKRRLEVAEGRLEGARKGAEATQRITYLETQTILKEIDSAYKELSLSQRRLVDAEANLEASRLRTQQLKTKAIELMNMQSIVKDKTELLGALKPHIDPLIHCFNRFKLDGEWISEQVDTLLRALKHLVDSEAVTVNARLGRVSRRVMVDATLLTQGGFSSIADISEAYMTISSTCVQPAIDQMESLANCSNDDWPAQSNRFMSDSLSWCDKIIDIETDAFTQASLNMKKQMVFLQERAMEVPVEA